MGPADKNMLTGFVVKNGKGDPGSSCGAPFFLLTVPSGRPVSDPILSEGHDA